jgi:hypothetical protein
MLNFKIKNHPKNWFWIQLSVISYQLSVISYQLSVISQPRRMAGDGLPLFPRTPASLSPSSPGW